MGPIKSVLTELGVWGTVFRGYCGVLGGLAAFIYLNGNQSTTPRRSSLLGFRNLCDKVASFSFCN